MTPAPPAAPVTWVTGAAGGIGAATARLLAQEGARLAVSDLPSPALSEVARELDALEVGFDLTELGAAEAAVQRIERELGPVSRAALVAGIFDHGPFLSVTDDALRRLFEVNFFGGVRCLQAVTRRMRDRGAGSVVVVASNSAKVLRLDQTGYGASKAALTYYAKAAGLELAPLGVRVNVVHPGTTASPMTRRVWDAAGISEPPQVRGDLARYRAPIPARRIAAPEDVASAIAYLLSDAAAHVVLADLVVDGGAILAP